MSISLDITFFIQLVNFLISLYIINALIIKPIRSNMAKRQAILNEDSNETEKFTSLLESQQKTYEERLSNVRKEIVKERESIKQQAEDVAQTTLHKANDEARSLRQESVQKVQAESKKAVKELQAKVPAFSKEALSKILA